MYIYLSQHCENQIISQKRENERGRGEGREEGGCKKEMKKRKRKVKLEILIFGVLGTEQNDGLLLNLWWWGRGEVCSGSLEY